MINVDGVEYRNLEEQVQFLTDKYNGLDETFASKEVVNNIASVLNDQQSQITSANQEIANVNQQIQTVDGKFSNYIPILGTQIIDAKIFRTEIALQSPEGEITRLKNINHNIVLTNGNGVNLLNIDEQLQKVQAFGKTLATLEDVASGEGTKVTVAGQVQSTWDADSKADATTVSTLSQTVSANTLAISGLAENKADKTSIPSVAGLASESWVNQQISAEATERQQSDSNLQSQITTLDSTTTSLDTRLSQASSQISAESTTRQNSDALLQAQIDSINTKNTQQDSEIAGIGSVCDELGVNNSSGSTTLSQSITNYKFIWITNIRTSEWKSSYFFPVAWLKTHYGQDLNLEFYDGSRLRCNFSNANTFQFGAGYYSGEIHIYGIK